MSMYSFLFQVLIPFILSALVVIIVMFIAETYGSKVGGILGTLPSTIVVAFVFISLSEGPKFASDAAVVVPAELGVNVIFLFVFSLLVRRSIALSFGVTFLIWTILSFLLVIFEIDSIITSILIYLVCMIGAFFYLEKKQKIPSQPKVAIHYTIKKILFRGVLAGTVIALAVVLSNVGSIISGIFSVFPAILSSTMLISVREHGPEFASGMAKSMMIGLSSVATYATVINILYPISGVLYGSLAAYGISFCVTLCIFLIRNKMI
jgi:uncharacterized membrane protein (GlpM family)